MQALGSNILILGYPLYNHTIFYIKRVEKFLFFIKFCEICARQPGCKLVKTTNRTTVRTAFCREKSVLDTGIAPQAEDQVLMLSTCVDSSSQSPIRWVVLAVLSE